MFQFRRFPTYAYLIQRRLTEYCSAGFPHSVIPGSMPMCGSPRLIAACHDLLRLLMPRHSPCALFSLTSSAWTSYPSLPPPAKALSLRHASSSSQTRFRWALLGERSENLGSLRIMQASTEVLLGSLFYPISQVTQLALPSVACSQYFFLHCSVFKVPAFQPFSRPDRNICSQVLRSILDLLLEVLFAPFPF